MLNKNKLISLKKELLSIKVKDQVFKSDSQNDLSLQKEEVNDSFILVKLT